MESNKEQHASDKIDGEEENTIGDMVDDYDEAGEEEEDVFKEMAHIDFFTAESLQSLSLDNQDYSSLGEVSNDSNDVADCSIDEDSRSISSPIHHSQSYLPVGSGFNAIKLVRSIDTETTALGTESINENLLLENTSNTAIASGPISSAVEKRSSLKSSKMNEKILKHLNDIMLQKKTKETLLLHQKQVSRKRMQITSIRIYNESIERKTMAKHDKYLNGIIPSVVKDSGPSKPVIKITPELSNSIYNRLVAKQVKALAASEMLSKITSISSREYTDWKLKHSIPITQKVFTISGWYPCIKEALIQRGWHYCADYASPYFDMKWSNKTTDIEHDILQPWQLTNHFTNNITLTTKAGLIKSLESLRWLSDSDINDIMPRAYDMSSEDNVEEFIADFQHQRAENILKNIYFRLYNSPYHTDGTSLCTAPLVFPLSNDNYLDTANFNNNVLINKVVFGVACKVIEQYLKSIDVNNIDNVNSSDNGIISRADWEILSYDEFKQFELPAVTPEYDYYYKKINLQSASAYESKKYNLLQKQLERYRSSLMLETTVLREVRKDDLIQIHSLLSRLNQCSGNQARINGSIGTARNIWIVKPAAKSRGRGISVFSDLPKLLKYIELGTTISSQNLWVVQKYIENPLIIANRKFDLRQWVLVTDWNPLTIYFYDEFYARFSVEEYSVEDSSIDNAFIHLVNNSIGKHSEKFHDKVVAENGVELEGFMWDFSTFCSYIGDKMKQSNYVIDQIQPRMKDIVINSLSCGCDTVTHRKNSWELYGFDFMIDDQLSTWLIEINSSPACDYSTKTTEVYVKKALVSILSVVLDLNEWERKDRDARGPKPDIGGWIPIHRGVTLDVPVASFGADMGLKGNAMRCPPKKVPIRVFNGAEILLAETPIAAVDSESAQDSHKEAAVAKNRSVTRRTVANSAARSTHKGIAVEKLFESSIDDSDSDEAVKESVVQEELVARRGSFRDKQPRATSTIAKRRVSAVVSNNVSIPIKTFLIDL